MTFWSFLRLQRERTDPVGQLAREAERDPTWPRRARSFPAVEFYLLSTGASSALTRACQQAHDEWRRGADTGEDDAT